MPRSVVLHGSARCPRCRLAPRWCVCAAGAPLALPLAVDVLAHPREIRRPSSTAHFLHRLVPATRLHVWQTRDDLDRAAIVRPERELWVLHPLGEPPPAGTDPARLQVLLLDGNWRQSLVLLRRVETWGRPVRLALADPSRFWLRTPHSAGRASTAEALIGLLDFLGLTAARDRLQVQFELQVYAGLCARGKRADAERLLATSALREVLAPLVQRWRDQPDAT